MHIFLNIIFAKITQNYYLCTLQMNTIAIKKQKAMLDK